MTSAIKTHLSEQALVTTASYQKEYQRSIDDPQSFWSEQATRYLTWQQPWKTVLTGSFEQQNIRWFEGAKLNPCVNCLDRHLPERAEQVAIIWEGDEPDQSISLTYQQLLDQVCRFANVLKAQGVVKGDRVCLYMPMIPEAAIAMLACSRIGAVHSVVFGGFSPEALQNRLIDAKCSVLITADEGVRGGKAIPLKSNADRAVADCPFVKKVIVVKHSGNAVPWDKGRDVDYQQAMDSVSSDCPAEELDANDPLFILYTSGSTGKPKGIVHAIGGYLLYATMSFKLIFNYQEGDIYWCTADVGWITGHSYLVYGPLANGATSLMFAGTPTYPDASRFWQVIDKHQVNIFYTAPTAIRALMREGDEWLNTTKRKSLKLLGTVGEPINPAAWQWYYQKVGENRCPIVDTWWQTETGGIMITPLPYATPLKPGAASWPFFGVAPGIVDEQGELISDTTAAGNLVITQPWPGLARTVYGDHERYKSTYFSDCPGYYFCGDGAERDADGYYWISGRVDDVINVSGHRLGTAEIESALVAHSAVAEAAVVDSPHAIKGQGIYAFVIPFASVKPDEALTNELEQWLKKKIGGFAKPDHVHWTPELPKTRSGKIMRRILRKLVHGQADSLGDISTLANPEIVGELKESILAALEDSGFNS